MTEHAHPATSAGNDPLLVAARVILWLLIGVLGFAAVMLAISAPALVIFQDSILAEMAANGVGKGGQFILPLAGLLLIVAGIVALAIWFLLLLNRIVVSVGEGDPFVPENARRLSLMGWIALAGQLAMLPLGGLAMWLADAFKDVPDFHFDADFGIDGSGILLVLVLFILARVFRHGTAMRDDLEGTV